MINQMAIDCFLSLSETLNFTETARQMFITQQAVSRHIARLEEDLGFTLFIRSRHSVTITEAGHAYAELLSRHKQEFEKASGEIARLYLDCKVRIHIAYLDWLDIASPINKALQLLRRDIPGLQFSAERQRQERLNALMAEHKTDGIITYAGFASELKKSRSTVLTEAEYVLLAGSVPANKTPSLADFRCETYIKPQEIDESEAVIREKAVQDCRRFGLEPKQIRTAPNIETAYTLAEMGEGVLISTTLSRMAVGGTLSAYPTGQREKLVFIWNGDDNNRYLMKFIDFLKAAFF